MKQKLVQLREYLKSKNKFILQDPASFEQKFAITLSKRNTIFVGFALFLIIGFVFYLIVAFTSLRNLIPGFPKNATELYEIDKKNQEMMILLEIENENRNKWIANLTSILNNEDSISLSNVRELVEKDSAVDYKKIIFERSKEDSILRKKIALQQKGGSSLLIRNILENVMNYKQPHPGVIRSEKNDGVQEVFYKTTYKSEVTSTMQGVVISKTANSLFVQHPHNLLSAYYNLEDINARIGSEVETGERIGIMRDTVLRYQLWYKGKTVSTETFSDL